MPTKEEYEAYEIGIQDQRRQSHRDQLELMREIEKLKAENASLWALAKLGRWVLDQLPTKEE